MDSIVLLSLRIGLLVLLWLFILVALNAMRRDANKAAGVYQGADALTPDDIADAVHWVATRPARVNVNTLQVMPVAQSFGPLRIHRE